MHILLPAIGGLALIMALGWLVSRRVDSPGRDWQDQFLPRRANDGR